MRAYWKGDGGVIGELGYRLTGSSDLYAHNGRRPYASINFVTCHDGFSLHDLVSYNNKHNSANGEDNRDGCSYSASWNHGVEGPSNDHEIKALRARQKRNFLASLMLSQGVPMLLSGDETGRTQDGNNNAYCQDSEISWNHWDLNEEDKELLAFVRKLIQIRKDHPIFRRRQFFQGRRIKGAAAKDITWLTPEGREMTDDEWTHSFARCLGMYLAGQLLDEMDERARPIVDDDFLVLLNAHAEEIEFTLPKVDAGAWEVLLDTSHGHGLAGGLRCNSAENYLLQGRSFVLLKSIED